MNEVATEDAGVFFGAHRRVKKPPDRRWMFKTSKDYGKWSIKEVKKQKARNKR